jgi:hypothetical protein
MALQPIGILLESAFVVGTFCHLADKTFAIV